MTDVRKFTLNTDYPLDQIVYMLSGSYTQTGGGGVGTTVNIAHGLSFRPLLAGSWSTSSDFSVTKEFFVPVYTDADGTYVNLASNDTNVVISGIKFPAGSQTIYYRVYGFMPSNANADVSPTASIADKFVFNTDYNYTKLYYNELITAAATTTITHNFGYRPQIMAWSVGASNTTIMNQDYTSYVTVTTSNVVVKSAANDVHLRIYADNQL